MTWIPYRHLGLGMAPVVATTLKIGSDFEDEALLLLDTGAIVTLFDGMRLRSAGIDIFSGLPRIFQSFSGGRTVAYLHPCRLVLGSAEIEVEAAFTTQPLVREVLGRDVLWHFQLWLRERSMEFRLEVEA